MGWADKFKKMVEDTKAKSQPPQPDPEPPQMEIVVMDSEQPKPKKKKQDDRKRKRSVAVTIRMSPEEVDLLNKKVAASGKSKTDFLIAAMQDVPIIVMDDVPQLVVQLRKQGNNLNQAVRLAHQTQSPNLPELTEALNECHRLQREISDFLDKWNVQLAKKE